LEVLITGGAGFLGRRLTRKLLERPTLTGPDGRAQPIERIVLLDVAAAPDLEDPRVGCIVGDLANPALLRHAVHSGTGSIFHLAAVVSGQAEAEFDLGMRVNVDATRALLEACRTLAKPPRCVFASSVAVYGGELPETVVDTTAVDPRSSYGVEKAIGELLVSEYSRRGFVDGRVLRLPTISVRPGKPNQAASSFASGIVREPLNGERGVCPVAPGTRVWLLSPREAIENLIVAHELAPERLQGRRTINVPGVSVTVQEMVQALERVAGAEVAKRVEWRLDPTVDRIVSSWPGAWDATRARALGFTGDADFDAIIRAYIEDERPRFAG